MGQNTSPPEKPAKSERESFSAYVQIVGPVFYDRDLTDKAKLLYGLLAAMTQPPLYYAYAKNATLCRYLCCSERTLQKYLRELTDRNEIQIEHGEGGRQLRKIKVARLQPFYPAESCGVNPAESCGVNPAESCGVANNSNNNKKKKNKKDKSAQSEADILDYLDRWAARWSDDPDDIKPLIKNLHAFADFRAAKGKPILTFGQADYLLSRLSRRSSEEPHRIPAMCFMLETAVLHNWEEPYKIDFRTRDSYEYYLASDLGIVPDPEPASDGGISTWL